MPMLTSKPWPIQKHKFWVRTPLKRNSGWYIKTVAREKRKIKKGFQTRKQTDKGIDFFLSKNDVKTTNNKQKTT